MTIKTNKRIKNLTNIEAYGKFFDNTKDLLVSAVVLIAIFCAWGSAGFIETHDFFNGVVVEVNAEDETVAVLDENGEVWEVYAVGLALNDEVEVTIDNQGTTTFCDDEVIDIKKIKNK